MTAFEPPDDLRGKTFDRFLSWVVTYVDRPSPTEADKTFWMNKVAQVFVDRTECFQLGVSEREELRALLLSQDERLTIGMYANLLAHKLRQMPNATVISVGSGAFGDMERALDAELQTCGVRVQRWVAIEPHAQRTIDSFFADENFFSPDPNDARPYVSITGIENEPTIVIANFSVHHMQFGLSEFLKRAQGVPVILLEELISPAESRDIDALMKRVAYDVLANWVLNPGWIDHARAKPGAFTVNYVEETDVARLGGGVWPIGDAFPPMALVDFSPNRDLVADQGIGINLGSKRL